MSIYIKLDGHNTAVLNYTVMNGNIKYRMITNLNVPVSFRRRGIAHKLLTSLCDIADKEHFIVFAYVLSSKEMSKAVFIRMMKRHKFDLLNKEIICRHNNVNSELLLSVLKVYEEEVS